MFVISTAFLQSYKNYVRSDYAELLLSALKIHQIQCRNQLSSSILFYKTRETTNRKNNCASFSAFVLSPRQTTSRQSFSSLNNPTFRRKMFRKASVLDSLTFQNLGEDIRRKKSNLPFNIAIMFVPQQEAWIVERMGRFRRVMEPGFNLLIPIVDRIKYVQSLKETAIDVPKQSAITSDNVTLSIDGVLYLKIVDAYLASYGVEDAEFAVTQLAQTTMRSELGKISLDNVFRERESLNTSIVESINKASAAWGITCLRYEIRDIKLPSRIHEAMQMQVEAERKKRAAILESEGIREADINVAEGKRQAKILQSEAEREQQINVAWGEAEALMKRAKARAEGLKIIAEALETREGKEAASLSVAEQYVQAFQNMAKTNNTMILPNNTGDVSGSVTQAMTIYKMLSSALDTGKHISFVSSQTSETSPGHSIHPVNDMSKSLSVK